MVRSGRGAHEHVCRGFGRVEFASQLFCAAKGVAVALHDQRRHSGADELGKAARSLPSGRAGRKKWKPESQDACGTCRLRGSACHPRAAAASARHQSGCHEPGRENLTACVSRHRDEGDIEPRRGHRSPLPGNPVRLLDKPDRHSQGAGRTGNQQKVRSGDASACSVTKQEDGASALVLTRDAGMPRQPGQTTVRRNPNGQIRVMMEAHASNRNHKSRAQKRRGVAALAALLSAQL
jgi:hypothetical protein